ncbi:MAG: HAMP domain-containing histidine kinase [Anaeroplasmataceae bacterium]|nr:HAMP domain-containing histidine kinase [Anaeroplasmataceae bacterium]
MRRKFFIILFFFSFLIEIGVIIIFSSAYSDKKQDVVMVNEVLHQVCDDWESMDKHQKKVELEYAVINNSEEVIYQTKDDISTTINEAISHSDTILDIKIEDMVVGKIIIYNTSAARLESQKQIIVWMISMMFVVQLLLGMGYFLYLHHIILNPFSKLKGFAQRIASGNLDIPLEMDRYNLFGAFTESFDLMRSELKKARIREAKANESKKELVAKLSHDIKTPVASIKAISEVGLEISKIERDKDNYHQIIRKADQINTLISNLFTATLEELQQLSVCPIYLKSSLIKGMLENADYMHCATIPSIPECLIYADSLRLQQVFDNIFANAYKYAKTDISVSIWKDEQKIKIVIEDFGGGVKEEELSHLKEKFKRGSNAKNIEGAGLGLYISDYFLKEMHGNLQIENGASGLRVIVILSIKEEK